MVEILKRKIKAKHEILIDANAQVSINDHGHLVIRYYKSELPRGDAKKLETEDEDIIIVFEAATTRRIRRFLSTLRSYDC